MLGLGNTLANHRVISGGGRGLPSELQSLFSALTYCEVVGNELIGVVNGKNFAITGKDFVTTNYIPGTSACTLALPNEAPLKTDDNFDGLWYSDAGAVNNVTIPFLQVANYSRTLIKYSNEAPYDIHWIGLLDDSANPTTDQWNQLHTYFQLDFWWSGGFNAFGVAKDNRALEGQGYKGWINTVITLGATQPTELVKASLNKTVLHILKNDISIWNSIDVLFPWMLNDSALVATTGCISMINGGVNTPTFPVVPTFTTSGFEGNASTQYCNTQYNASVHGNNYTQNSASRGHFKYKAGVGASGLDGHPSFTGNNSMQNSSSGANRINSSGNAVTANFGGVGLKAITRDGSNISGYSNGTVTTGSVASVALINENFSVLRSSFGYSDAGVAFTFYGGFLTTTQLGILNTAFTAHKTRLGL